MPFLTNINTNNFNYGVSHDVLMRYERKYGSHQLFPPFPCIRTPVRVSASPVSIERVQVFYLACPDASSLLWAFNHRQIINTLIVTGPDNTNGVCALLKPAWWIVMGPMDGDSRALCGKNWSYSDLMIGGGWGFICDNYCTCLQERQVWWPWVRWKMREM